MVGAVFNTGTTLSGNIAFGGIINYTGTTIWNDTGATKLDGETKTADELQVSDGFPTGFDASSWTYEAGKLPGFGSTVPMPLHLSYISDKNFVGAGSDTDLYLIATAEHLAKLAELVNAGNRYDSKYFKLTANIHLSADKSDQGWVPIGNSDSNRFNGKFDGNGKTVTNLYINRPGSNYQGLFGVIDTDGQVKDLGVVSCDIKGGSYVGGVVGYTRSTLTNCYTTGSVSGTDNVGGVAGFVTGTLTNCYATGTVSGTDNVGGVAGYLRGTVENCAALNPSVKGTGTNVGRVVGYWGAGSLINNYAFSGMTGGGSAKTLDGLDGKDMNATQAVTDTFWTTAANWNTTTWNTADWEFTDGKLPI